jgi:hypothetical protein
MAHSGDPAVGGGNDAPPLRDTLAETGRGVPDDAIGPEQRTLPEQMEFADSPEGRRIEQKLRAEALARRSDDDEEPSVDDSTGHA